jgi:hypothetical protein
MEIKSRNWNPPMIYLGYGPEKGGGEVDMSKNVNYLEICWNGLGHLRGHCRK